MSRDQPPNASEAHPQATAVQPTATSPVSPTHEPHLKRAVLPPAIFATSPAHQPIPPVSSHKAEKQSFKADHNNSSATADIETATSKGEVCFEVPPQTDGEFADAVSENEKIALGPELFAQSCHTETVVVEVLPQEPLPPPPYNPTPPPLTPSPLTNPTPPPITPH